MCNNIDCLDDWGIGPHNSYLPVTPLSSLTCPLTGNVTSSSCVTTSLPPGDHYQHGTHAIHFSVCVFVCGSSCPLAPLLSHFALLSSSCPASPRLRMPCFSQCYFNFLFTARASCYVRKTALYYSITTKHNVLINLMYRTINAEYHSDTLLLCDF